GERLHDRVRCGLSVKPATDSSFQNGGPEPVQHEGRVAVRGAHRSAHPGQLVVEGALPDARRRRNVGAEDADAEPAAAPQGAETVAVLRCELHGRAPVGLDAEIPGPEAPSMPPAVKTTGTLAT